MAIASAADVPLRPTTATSASLWPSLIESLLAIAAIVALLPLFDRLAGNDVGRDSRFAGAAIAIGGLPARVLPGLCASHGALAEPLVRDRLCRRSDASSATVTVAAIPLPVVSTTTRSAACFSARLPKPSDGAILQLQQRQGPGDLLAPTAIESIDRSSPRRALRAGGREGGQPLPVACAFEMVKASLREPTRKRSSAATAEPTRCVSRRRARRSRRDRALAGGALLPAQSRFRVGAAGSRSPMRCRAPRRS